MAGGAIHDRRRASTIHGKLRQLIAVDPIHHREHDARGFLLLLGILVVLADDMTESAADAERGTEAATHDVDEAAGGNAFEDLNVLEDALGGHVLLAGDR